MHIRIGGIYALERIARDSARDHPTVIEVLAAFVRERSHDADAHVPAVEREELLDTDTLGRSRPDLPDELRDAEAVGRLRPDLQAAVTVIVRRDTTRDTDVVNLNMACLQRAALANAALSGADLSKADLSSAELTGADLSGANLREADLSRANLSGGNLSEANLEGADVSDANLSDVVGADMFGARGVPKVLPLPLDPS